jgi:hypothetical protein
LRQQPSNIAPKFLLFLAQFIGVPLLVQFFLEVEHRLSSRCSAPAQGKSLTHCLFLSPRDGVSEILLIYLGGGGNLRMLLRLYQSLAPAPRANRVVNQLKWSSGDVFFLIFLLRLF